MPSANEGRDSAKNSVALEYATKRDRTGLPPTVVVRLLIMAGTCVLLSVASLWVVYSNANDEPYFGTIRKSDALLQVGLGSVLITLWLGWCGVLMVLTISRKVNRGL